MKLTDLFPPGTDLCQIPSGAPPDGQVSNLHNHPTLRPLTIVLGVTLTLWAAVFALGRLYANIRKLTFSDGLVFVALLLDIAYAVVMIIFSGRFRHMWDVPLCMFDGGFPRVSYVWEVLNVVALLFAKTATLLLFDQLFTVSTRLRLAIRIGLAVNFVLYMTSIGVLAYYSTPHNGMTWEDLLFKAIRTPVDFELYWAVASGAVGTLLDVYIFVLPLPVILRLNLSRRSRIQVIAVFFTAVLGVLGSIVSLVYRVRSLKSNDKMWEVGVILNCNLVEMNVATIIASAPGFAKFMRRHVLESSLVKSLRSRLGGSSADSTSAEKRNPNQPRTGRGYGPPVLHADDRHYELNDAWLLKPGSTAAGEEGRPPTAEQGASGTSSTVGGDGWLTAPRSPV